MPIEPTNDTTNTRTRRRPSLAEQIRIVGDAFMQSPEAQRHARTFHLTPAPAHDDSDDDYSSDESTDDLEGILSPSDIAQWQSEITEPPTTPVSTLSRGSSDSSVDSPTRPHLFHTDSEVTVILSDAEEEKTESKTYDLRRT